MPYNDIDSLEHRTQQVNIYFGLLVLASGLLGNTLNIIIFLSLNTFRQTSCVFYLTIASAFNIFQLLASLLSRIFISGYTINSLQTSEFLCKARIFIAAYVGLVSLTCMCFAVADQFASLSDRWNYLCKRRVAYGLLGVTAVVWCIPASINAAFVSIRRSPAAGQPMCTFTNKVFADYNSKFHFPILLGILPISIRVVFGLLAFITARSQAKRKVPIVRLSRDKQLTWMILIELLVDVVLLIPFVIYHIYSINTSFPDPMSSARDQLIYSVTVIFYYSRYAASFYIYCCSSSRFRKQLVFALFTMHLKCWRHQEPQQHDNNRVAPQPLPAERTPPMLENIELW